MAVEAHPPAASDLLALWEWGRSQAPAWRGLGLLQAAYPEADSEILRGLTVGQRDALLLALHELLFGPRLMGVSVCAACGEHMEVEFSTFDLLGLQAPLEATQAAKELFLERDGWQVTYRLPVVGDLLALLPGDAAYQALMERCVLKHEHEGEPAAELPDWLAEAVQDCMAQADPLADIRMELVCPACGEPGQVEFDVLDYLWEELQVWALQTLRDVHLLAAAYGWGEAEVLALSPRRRKAYLELVMEHR